MSLRDPWGCVVKGCVVVVAVWFVARWAGWV